MSKIDNFYREWLLTTVDRLVCTFYCITMIFWILLMPPLLVTGITGPYKITAVVIGVLATIATVTVPDSVALREWFAQNMAEVQKHYIHNIFELLSCLATIWITISIVFVVLISATWGQLNFAHPVIAICLFILGLVIMIFSPPSDIFQDP